MTDKGPNCGLKIRIYEYHLGCFLSRRFLKYFKISHDNSFLVSLINKFQNFSFNNIDKSLTKPLGISYCKTGPKAKPGLGCYGPESRKSKKFHFSGILIYFSVYLKNIFATTDTN